MSSSVADKIMDSFSSPVEEVEMNPFLAFEPFDIEKRPQWVNDQMQADGVNLYEPEYVEAFGSDPHPFQTGYLMSKGNHRVLLAGSRVGKSQSALIEAAIMATHQVPHSMRVPRGVDTGVKRVISKENIFRWGRRDLINGDLIDRNIYAKRDGSWDCGTIVGVGVYPSEKFCPPGRQIWLGSTAKALQNYWWPKFMKGKECVLPEDVLDTEKGSGGYNRTNHIVHFNDDIDLIFISYESQYDKFEAQEAWAVILDEEPPNEKVLPAAASHAVYMSIVETPYRGITFSEDFIFNTDISKRPEIYHCCAYDSPYRPVEKIKSDRKTFKPWDIKSRIWGLFSEITGEPYFDREKLMAWYDQLREKEPRVKKAIMVPQLEYDEMSEVADIEVKPQWVDEWDEQAVWRIFELPRPGTGYVAGIDLAEGAEKPQEAADRNTCAIFRPPIAGEPRKPVKVASLRSTLLVDIFARVVLQGCSYYNNALLAPESVHGYANGAFMLAVQNWPNFFVMMTVNDKTRKPSSRKGFVMSGKSRDTLFKRVERDITETSVDEPCPFKDIDLVKELMMAIGGKNGRCDHTRKGSLDTVVAHGIGLYVFEVSPEQIRCFKNNEDDEFKEPFSRLKWILDGRPPVDEGAKNHPCAFI